MTLKRQSGRPRSAATDKAILDISLALLKQGGLFDFSLEKVADLAQVSRTSIYRRWPNKTALAFFLLEDNFRLRSASSEKGGFRQKLRFFLRKLATQHQTPMGRVLVQLLAVCRTDKKEMTAYRRAFLFSNRAYVSALLTEGIAEGAIRKDIDKTLAVDAFLGPIFFAISLGDTISREAIDALILLVLSGIEVKPKNQG